MTTKSATMENITFSIGKAPNNGYKTVKVKAVNYRAFTIYTNGNLPQTHRYGICKETYNEAREYIRKNGTDYQKRIFAIPTHEYPLVWNGEEIDTATSMQDAKYLQKEYNLAFGGGVRLARKRKI